MTETVTSRDSTSMPPRPDRRRRRAVLPVRRFALGVATGFVLAASLLAVCTACGSGPGEYISGGQQIDWITITDHLYLEKDGTKFEISVGKDASGKDVVTATRVGK